MMKQLTTSLTLAALLSLSVPLASLADDMTQPGSAPSQSSQQPSTSPSDSSQYTPSTQPGMSQSATPSSPSSALSTQPGASDLTLANQFGYANNEVVIGTADGVSPMVLPKIQVGSANTSILVVNPTPKPATFSSPNLGINAMVPANSERVIQIDRAQTANLTPGQEVAYYINDSDGNQLASSSFLNNASIASSINTNTTVAEESTTTTTSATSTEPSRPAAKPMQKRATVRGYW